MLEHIIEWQQDRNLDKMPYDHFNESVNIFEELLETYGLKRDYASDVFFYKVASMYDEDANNDEKVDAYFDICVYAIGAIMKLGYDPIKVFEEGLKEINDRTGSYDQKVGKWVKEPKKPNAYKADYSKAKL